MMRFKLPVTRRLLVGACVLFGLSNLAFAQFSITITVDENCHGQFTNTTGFLSALPCAQQQDPGPGGLANAVTYGLLGPPGLVAGDLIILESVGSLVGSDLIRFNPNELIAGTTGALVFYSDIAEGGDSLADLGNPTSLYTNNLSVVEVGPEGVNGFSYTPTAGQPGFIGGAAGPVTYVIQSDVAAPVPEPGTVLLAVPAFGLILISVVRRRRARA